LNRKVMLLNMLLVALALWLGWTLRTKWLDEEAHRGEVLKQAIRSVTVPPPPPTPAVQRPVAVDYLEVAQRTLFTKDRNPNVVIDTPPPPPPPPPVPPLPVYRGQMAIGEQPVVFLATSPTDEKGYRKGDMVGKFKLVAFDRDNITLEWDGKNLEHKVTDLVSKEPQQAQQPVVAAAPAAAAAVTSLSGQTAQKLNGNSDNPTLGVDMGGPRACVAGDNSPAGTILSGYKKVISATLMGQSCHWEPVNK
jgi:hypothetical protein